MAYNVLDNICQLTPTGFNTKIINNMELTNYNSKNKDIMQIQLFFMFEHEMEKTMKRQNVSRKSSKRSFKKGMRTQVKNLMPAPQRGGYRL